MSIFAEIESGAVANIVTANAESDLDSSKKWAPVGSNQSVDIGWSASQASDGTWSFTQPAPPTPTLPQAKQAKRAEIQASAEQAMIQPISFTNAAGTQATFPMDQKAQLKYLAAYTRYVVHSKALPSNGVSFMDVQGNPISMTVADIDSMSDPVFGQIETVENKASGYYSQINAVTTSTTNPVQTVNAITWS